MKMALFQWILLVSMALLHCTNAYRCGQRDECECIRQRGLILCTDQRLTQYPAFVTTQGFSYLVLRKNRLNHLPNTEYAVRFHHIDLRNNLLNCSQELDFRLQLIVLQNSCNFTRPGTKPTQPPLGADARPTPETGARKAHDFPRSPLHNHLDHSSKNNRSDSPILTIALSSSGAIAVCLCVGTLVGIYVKYRRGLRTIPNEEKHGEVPPTTSSSITDITALNSAPSTTPLSTLPTLPSLPSVSGVQDNHYERLSITSSETSLTNWTPTHEPMDIDNMESQLNRVPPPRPPPPGQSQDVVVTIPQSDIHVNAPTHAGLGTKRPATEDLTCKPKKGKK